jgi:hypothetical protein
LYKLRDLLESDGQHQALARRGTASDIAPVKGRIELVPFPRRGRTNERLCREALIAGVRHLDNLSQLGTWC